MNNASKYAKSFLIRSLVKDYDFIAFVDGAWKRSRNNQGTGGIGGLLLSNCMQLKFIFSGSSQESSIMKVELQAFIFMCQVCQRYWPGKKVVICSDAKMVVNSFIRLKSGLHNINLDLDLSGFDLDISYTWACYIKRELNSEADFLAKGGVDRPKLIVGRV